MAETFGFPPGYFLIRSKANNRLFDIEMDDVEDGTEVILHPSKEFSLVESMRNPEGNNQVFFIDTSGALCSRSSGHAIDIEDGRLVLRHRRPVSLPYPNAYSHPLPQFRYDPQTGEISVTFFADPTYPPPPPPSSSDDATATAAVPATTNKAWTKRSYVLSAIPLRRPPTLVDNAAAFLSSAITTPLSFFAGIAAPVSSSEPAQQQQQQRQQHATPDEVFSGDIDLAEDDVLEEERGEEGEVDDSPEKNRRVRMLTIVGEERHLGQNARVRRQWETIPLRASIRRTSTEAYR